MNNLNIIELAIADDNTDFRSLFAKLLTFESCGGIHVQLEARNGAELLHGLREQVPHIILIDLRMPVMDGFETARILHALFPEVILVGFSDTVPSMHTEELYRLGFRSFIRKDLGMREVVDSLRRIRRGEWIADADRRQPETGIRRHPGHTSILPMAPERVEWVVC